MVTLSPVWAVIEIPSDFELGPKMLACSAGERRFVWAWVIGDAETYADAARDAGYVDNENGAIRRRGHQIMHRERVLAAIEELGKQAYRSQLVPALRANLKLITNASHPDHARTVRATLASLGLGERTAVDVNVGGSVDVNHTDAALNDLRTLIKLCVPREKLVEIFGFSGLSRYEQMLAEQDARRLPGPVIEHEIAGG